MAIRGSKLFGQKKRILAKRNPIESRRPRMPKFNNLKRQRNILKLVDKYGPTKAIKKLKLLARRNPSYADKIWDDAKWLVGYLSGNSREPGGAVSNNSEVDAILDRQNPDFEWGPKLFNPLTDEHPFEKNPMKSTTDDVGGLFSSLYQRKNNPDTGGLFTSIFNRRKRNFRSY